MTPETCRILLALLKVYEGMHRIRGGMVYPYLCPAGYPTQGLGIRVESLQVPPITPAEAERRAVAALSFYVSQTIKLCPVLGLPGNERKLAAIADFCYNLGPAALAGSTLRKRVNAQDWEGAQLELKKWVRGGGRVLPGLVKRRHTEAGLLVG